MKSIPTTIDSKTLAQLADPTDTHAVRLIQRQVHNFSPYRMSGKRYKYIFTHDSRIGAHVLDVPLSLWQGDVPKSTYRDNLSICHDIQGNRSTLLPPIVCVIIPLHEGVAEFEKQSNETQADPMPAMLETLTGFLRDMDAPDEIMQAMAILSMPGADAQARESALTAYVAGVRRSLATTDEPEPQITDIDPPEQEPAAKPRATAKQSVAEKKRKASERARKSRELKKQAELEAALV
jgi:hypothetical protein